MWVRVIMWVSTCITDGGSILLWLPSYHQTISAYYFVLPSRYYAHVFSEALPSCFGVQWLLISVVHGDLIVPFVCTSTMQYRASSNLLERSSIGTRVSPKNKFLGPLLSC